MQKRGELQMNNSVWNRIKERYNEIAPHVFDKVAGWSSIIGLAFTILTIINPDWFNEFWNKWFENRWEVIVVILVVLLLVVLLLMAMKYRNSVIIKMNALSRGFSYVMEKTINTIDAMEQLECEIDMRGQKCEECSVRSNSIRVRLDELLVNYANAVSNMLSKTFSEHVSFHVSTCIKLVDPASDEENIDKQYVTTLARDEDSEEKRGKGNNKKRISISQNSDFLNIITGSREGNGSAPFFYVSDLIKYSNLLERVSDGEYKYLNSTPNWQKYYVATMVVPIGKVVDGPNRKHFKVWAFLCADSLSTKAFTKRQKTINIKIMASFANMISLVLRVYYEKTNQYNSERKKENVETGVE